MRRLLLTLLALAVPATRAHAQHFGLEFDRDSVKLGEVVMLRARIQPKAFLTAPAWWESIRSSTSAIVPCSSVA